MRTDTQRSLIGRSISTAAHVLYSSDVSPLWLCGCKSNKQLCTITTYSEETGLNCFFRINRGLVLKRVLGRDYKSLVSHRHSLSSLSKGPKAKAAASPIKKLATPQKINEVESVIDSKIQHASETPNDLRLPHCHASSYLAPSKAFQRMRRRR